jgi:hypothetical protein
MLSLLIPVTEDTTAEQVINIIGRQVVEALERIHAQTESGPSEAGGEDPEAIPQDQFNETVLRETLEAYTDNTREDLLGKLGYPAEA